jgi:hypothetical protein
MPHVSLQELRQRLAQARAAVKVGGVYAHYKHPDRPYKVVGIGVQEATDLPCVLYQLVGGGEPVVFVRDVADFLAMVPSLASPEELVPRFQLVNAS